MHETHESVDARALTARVASLIDSGRTGAARPLLAAARRIVPPSPQLALLGARLAMREGRLELAQSELNAAIEQTPDDTGLLKCRADLRQQTGDKAGAVADAAEAVVLDRDDPVAKALLGVLMLELGRPTDATACLAEAVAADPAHPAYIEGLAAAQEAGGDADAAFGTLLGGIAAAPGSMALRNAATLLAVRRRDFTTAVRLADEASSAGVADACLFGLKGHALSSLERHSEAADAYAEAFKLGPNDAYVRHMVAASGRIPATGRAHVDYVRAVFDGYANRFDAHLISLGYRVPGLIRSALLQHPTIQSGEQLGPALDIGCGTGLVAVALSDLPIGPLVGLDVSPRMLAEAGAKQIYAELREGDLMQMLTEDSTVWRLILASDVLCYFGDLRDVLVAVRQRLGSSAWFIFSVEELLPDKDGVIHGGSDWALQRQGRYAHANAYVEKAALETGFSVRSLERQTLRYEGDAPVAGLLGVLEAV
jgi:predicted TPR repeat methyltransferase